MDQYQNPNFEVGNSSQVPNINPGLPQSFENSSTPTESVGELPVTSEQEVNTEKEGGKEYLRLLNLITDVEDTLGKLKEGINTLKDKEVNMDNEELSTDEDPRVVVQKLTQEISNEETVPNLEQVFDSYKQQLNLNPYAPLPKELSPVGEFGLPNPDVTDLSKTGTAEEADPRVEINPQTQQKEIVFPTTHYSFDYESFVKALQEGMQPPNEGVYFKFGDEGKKQIFRLNHFQFDKINNAILREKESENQAQQPVTPPTQSYEQPTTSPLQQARPQPPTREPEGFPQTQTPQQLGV